MARVRDRARSQRQNTKFNEIFLRCVEQTDRQLVSRREYLCRVSLHAFFPLSSIHCLSLGRQPCCQRCRCCCYCRAIISSIIKAIIHFSLSVSSAFHTQTQTRHIDDGDDGDDMWIWLLCLFSIVVSFALNWFHFFTRCLFVSLFPSSSSSSLLVKCLHVFFSVAFASRLSFCY